ncbi:MAG: Gfo/Idh/MocA family protein [Beutenbergiaceae bacterium]
MFELPTENVRWGIIGSAKITEVGLGPAVLADSRSRIVAVASRRIDAATASATALQAERAYGSYDELFADPDVDIVYNPLPNSLHHEWTMKALAAGKHVLCEKPMAMTQAEVQQMADAADAANLFLMEGFMWRFHPRVARIQELAARKIGPVRLVRTTYTFDLGAATDVRSGSVTQDIRMTGELGGGALGDVGSYCVNGLRTFAQGHAIDVSSYRKVGSTGVETQVAAQIQFDNGIVGQMYAAIDVPGGGHLEILGDGGRIRVPNAFRTRAEQGDLTIEIYDQAGRQVQVETLPFIDQYTLEIEHVAQVLLDGQAPTITLADSIDNARTIDAIRASWDAGSRPAQ